MTLAGAQDAYWRGNYTEARALLDESAQPIWECDALRTLCTVRQVFTGEITSDTSPWNSLASAISRTFGPARLEAERRFIQGWLSWVCGEFDAAATHFQEAVRQLEDCQEQTRQAEAAYWLARVRLQTRDKAAVAQYEQHLRTFSGLPRAVCWFVDLLWRGRQAERAEQVWQTLRGSARITACEEVFLIDARLLLWRGKYEEAEHALRDATPRNGVLRVERCLYLALVNLQRGRMAEADALMRQAESGPYPARALRTWQRLVPLCPETAEPPQGTPALAWRLHQAALALSRDDAATALHWCERAQRDDPALASAGDRASTIRGVLPELQQLARAQALAELACLEENQTKVTPSLLWGAAQCLDLDADGQAVLDAALRGDHTTATKQLETLATRDDLPPQAAHHLALIYLRAARHREQLSPSAAERYWRLAWQCWLHWARYAATTDRTMVVAWLLGLHRQALRDFLARGNVDDARRHWRCVTELAAQVNEDETLQHELKARIDTWRDELATEYLVMTREAMRFSAGQCGCDADYEMGLTWLTRLLSLDRDNLRLLTELVSICVAWFSESYESGDMGTIVGGVERFTPFALHLARLVEQSDGAELTARAALAEFSKFRGFVAPEPERKAALYREAFRWHPTSERARRLLAEGDAQP
jgi:tetratricopeptide (TPR) repeat protein